MKKENAIKYYRKFSGAEGYIIGFIYKHLLYTIEVNEIMPRFIKVEKSSQRNGAHEKLQLRLNNHFKEQLIRKGAQVIGTESDLLEIPHNKGVSFERLIYRLNGLTPRPKDNVGFWVSGDINLGGRELQIKLDGAQIVEFRTLSRLQKRFSKRVDNVA